jgi:hypothetical protein
LLYDPRRSRCELNRLKALVEKLANKVNAPGDTPEVRLGAVEDRVDEVALHGVRLGITLGLAAMSMLRTMCGSRTGGWSLPCVMSD